MSAKDINFSKVAALKSLGYSKTSELWLLNLIKINC